MRSRSRSTASRSRSTRSQAAGAGVAAPVQTVLLIDESGSMKGEAIKAASDAASCLHRRHAAGRHAPQLRRSTRQFRTLQTFTSDKNALKASLAGLNPQKETALYDALIKALASFGPSPKTGARYVILLSDGGDTASTATLDQATAAVRSSGIPVYAIGLKSTEFDSQPLASLAEASGSRYLETPDPGALTSLYQTLAKEIHNQYLLNFTLPLLDGGCRQSEGAGRRRRRRRRPSGASSIRRPRPPPRWPGASPPALPWPQRPPRMSRRVPPGSWGGAVARISSAWWSFC